MMLVPGFNASGTRNARKRDALVTAPPKSCPPCWPEPPEATPRDPRQHQWQRHLKTKDRDAEGCAANKGEADSPPEMEDNGRDTPPPPPNLLWGHRHTLLIPVNEQASGSSGFAQHQRISVGLLANKHRDKKQNSSLRQPPPRMGPSLHPIPTGDGGCARSPRSPGTEGSLCAGKVMDSQRDRGQGSSWRSQGKGSPSSGCTGTMTPCPVPPPPRRGEGGDIN